MKPVNPKKANRVLKTSTFSRRQLLSFVILFAIVGAYFLYKSFAAAPLVASMEAEQMVLPAGASVINDTSASGGKAAMIPGVGSATGSVSFPSSVNSVTVMAKAAQCQGAPTMAVVLDGTNLITTAVSSTSWTAYTATPTNAIASGTHSYSITFSNDYTKTKGNPRNQCSRTLYLDVSNFYGPTPVATPAPTVTLSASPTTVTAGQASTLTWASTNATSCSASGSWSGTEPTSGSLSTGALNQSSTYTLTCTGTGGSISTNASVTVAAATTSYASVTNFATPSFTPTRTIDVYNQSDFNTAWNNIQAGDLINVHGVTFSGEVTLANKQLANWAEIHFDSATKFIGYASAQNYPAVWLNKISHIRFYGGDISGSASGGQAGNGVLLYDSTYVTWWNFVIHDVGGQGFFATGLTTDSNNLDIKGEIYHWGLNLSWDPHTEKGTGIHAALLADSNYGVDNSRFAIYAHDGASGAGIEVGGSASTDFFKNNTVYAWCQNLTKVATSQVAGNCIQAWGNSVLNNTYNYIEAENLQGRPYDANGIYSSTGLTTDIVEYGIASNTNLNPYLSGTESAISPSMHWDTRGGTVFNNVSPTP